MFLIQVATKRQILRLLRLFSKVWPLKTKPWREKHRNSFSSNLKI